MAQWQHIEFTDGSNPYITKTEEEFQRILENYNLENLQDNFWLARSKKKEPDPFICPNCGGELLHYGDEDNGYGELHSYWTCWKCGKKGKAIYDMSDQNNFIGHEV